MIRQFNKYLLLTPDAVTGGPEAVHQLRQILGEMGLDAEIMVYREALRVEDGVISHPPVAPGVCIGAYDCYDPVYTDRCVLTEDTLVIIPEILPELARQVMPATPAVWWLSVINGFRAGGLLKEDEAFRTWFFGQPWIIHLAQTAHARRMLHYFRAPDAYDLVDYTDELFTAHLPTGPNPGGAIAFNPAKGAAYYEPFFAANPDLTALPIAGMGKPQVLETLRQARLYVEFGDNPGKDRLPREAACAGCIVLARREGGSELFDDTPIEPGHKFTAADIESGRLGQTVRGVIANPRGHWERQAYYRNYLFTEKDLMRLQARRLFAIG